MSLSITIQLNEQDIEHFTKAMNAARANAAGKPPAEVIAAASKLLEEAKKTAMPDFIAGRLEKLDDMIAMLKDEGWALPDADKQRVLSAMAYFADPSDVIPDSVPVLGFLDDAIMIELCARELKHELEAYDDFCDFRQSGALSRGMDPATVGRAELAGRAPD